MRKTLLILLLFWGWLSDARAQTPDTTRFGQAYTEIAAMLDGNRPLSIKRAVFLVEWASLDGNLDYDWYCRSIDSAVVFLNKFIAVNNLEKYKTGRNLALFTYFTEPLSGNGYKPFTYDFKEVSAVQERIKRMVSTVMRTHEGQCYSLPLYYRILAEALGAEAYLSFTPKHSFIRYRNEDKLFPEDWVNVELTTHQIQPESWIVEHSGISETMIDQKVYMHPLSVEETVACQLVELASCYAHKYPDSNPDFMLRCIDKTREYYPSNLRALFIKGYILNALIREQLDANRGITDDCVRLLNTELHELEERVKALGWTPESSEVLKRLDEEANQVTQQERSKIQ